VGGGGVCFIVVGVSVAVGGAVGVKGGGCVGREVRSALIFN
jgi:hypothetical protein